MGIRAIVEVLDHAPADLTPAERLILVAIAENINDNDPRRESWPGFNAEVLCRRTGLGPNGLRRAHQRLAARGLEVRIQIGADKNGDPVFAIPNVQTRYRLPRLVAQGDSPQAGIGGTQVPPTDEDGTQAPAGGTAVPPEPVLRYHHEAPEVVPEYRQAVPEYRPTPHPSKNPPQESAPSSLSQSEASTHSADPPPVVERETKSHSKMTINSAHQIVKDAGLLGDHEVPGFVDWMRHRYEKPGNPLGPPWWRALIRNKDLPEQIIQWYASQQPRAWDDYEETAPTYTEYSPAEFNPPYTPRPTSGPMATFDTYTEEDIWK